MRRVTVGNAARMRSVLGVALIVLGIAVAVPASSLASTGGGNSANAQLCQKGGWQNLFGSDGRTFSNAGDCGSYAAQGGAVSVPPQAAACVAAGYDYGGAALTYDYFGGRMYNVLFSCGLNTSTFGYPDGVGGAWNLNYSAVYPWCVLAGGDWSTILMNAQGNFYGVCYTGAP
jgi:hypothetical protein